MESDWQFLEQVEPLISLAPCSWFLVVHFISSHCLGCLFYIEKKQISRCRCETPLFFTDVRVLPDNMPIPLLRNPVSPGQPVG